MPVDMVAFGKYIRELREKKEYGVNQLAVYAGVSPAAISKLENGIRKGPPEPKTLKRLAAALGVSYTDLMERAGYLPPKMGEDDDDPLPPDMQADWNELREQIQILFEKRMEGELTNREIRMIIRVIKEATNENPSP